MIFGHTDRVDLDEIQKCGLLAVKIAQMYAVRADFLSVETCQKLQGLYEQTTPLPWNEYFEIYQSNASDRALNELVEFERECLAAASLGQVHRATLRDGSRVVVKVVKAAPFEELEQDLKAVRVLVECALFFYPRLERLADPRGTLTAIERLTLQEMDLRNEISGTQRLKSLRDEGAIDRPELSKLTFPHIYEEFTNTQVLVVEEIEEKSVRARLDDGEFYYKDVLTLFQIQGYFVFMRGEFHGDLHPGNVYGGASGFRMIDNANIETVDLGFSSGLLHFLNCLGHGKFSEAALVIEELAVEPLADNGVFVKAFETLYKGFDGKPIGEQSLTHQMMKTVRLAVESGLEFPEGVFPVIKTLMYLDGIALKCAPDRVLLNDVMKFSNA